MHAEKLNRRDFLKASAVLGAGLLIGCNTKSSSNIIPATGEALPEDGASFPVWLHIAPGGTITFMLPSVEMGQGVYTSLPMLICEELDADWDQLQIRMAPLDDAYIRPGRLGHQSTGGSSSVREWSPVLRKAGAAARLQLRKAAATKWNVPLSEVSTDAGEVVHASGKRLGYGEVALDAAKLEPPAEEEVQLKSREEFRLIGKDVKRLDTPLKTNGRAEYGIDVRLPGMVYATVECAPVFGGSLDSMDKEAALKVKGVTEVVEIPNGVAVVADTYYQAKMGLGALRPRFRGGDTEFSSEKLSEAFRRKLEGAGSKPAPGEQVLEAGYEVPFLAHACMEPMNCTVHVTDDRCDIWTPSQNLTLVGKAATGVTGLPLEKIHIRPTFLGGGFGRRLESDYVEQALHIGMAIRKPVMLIWSREEDTRHDFYRPASMARFEVTLSENGTIKDWRQVIVSPALMGQIWSRWNILGLGWLPYSFFTQDLQIEGTEHTYTARPAIEFIEHATPVPIGNWRAVGHTHNGFYVQSMMDEAAHAAGADPADYLRKHLPGQERHLGVLDLLTEKSGWGRAAQGRFQGVAIHESFQSVAAHVVEISVQEIEDGKQQLTIHRITTAIDCGMAVNPLGVRAQVESSIVWALTATLIGEISIKDGKVQQSNFHDYKMLRLKDIPPMDVHIVASDQPSTGVGEPAVPPLAPALTNAIFAATGKRLRSLPLRKHGFVL